MRRDVNPPSATVEPSGGGSGSNGQNPIGCLLVLGAIGLAALAGTVAQASFLKNWLLYAAAGLAVIWFYFLPYLKSNRSKTMFFLNLSLGWTVVGWLILMMYETRSQKADRTYRQMYPPSGIPPNPIYSRELKRQNQGRHR